MKLDGKYEVDEEGLLCLPVNLEGNLELEVRLEVEAIIIGGEHTRSYPPSTDVQGNLKRTWFEIRCSWDLCRERTDVISGILLALVTFTFSFDQINDLVLK